FLPSPPSAPRPPVVPYTPLFRSGLRTAGTLAGMLAIYLWKASGLVPVFVLCMTQMLRKNGRAGELWFALYEKQTRSQRRGRYYGDRKSTRLNSSHVSISYAVFCL